MHELKNDVFYDFINQFDSDIEYHIVGEIDYHLLVDDKSYNGLQSHREALTVVFDKIAENHIEHQNSLKEKYGDDIADQLSPLLYDVDQAQPSPLDPQVFFYCPNIVKIDYYGNAYYDAEWRPDDDNFGTTVPYWYALMEPVHGRRNEPEDFNKVNEALFPEGTDTLDIYEWTTDWSDFFDDGHEWYGACCWSIYDKSMNRYVVMLVSATD